MATKEQIDACATHYIGAEREAKFCDLILSCRKLLQANFSCCSQAERLDALWELKQVMWPDNGEPSLDEEIEKLEFEGFEEYSEEDE